MPSVFPSRARRRLKSPKSFNSQKLLSNIGTGRSVHHCPAKRVIYSQGERSDAVYYIQTGRVRLSVLSDHGKEATVGLLGPGGFFGVGSVTTGHPVHMTTATAITDCTLLRIDKKQMLRMLHENPEFSDQFVAYLIERYRRTQADLADQLFNSSEKRLARALLFLANFGKGDRPDELAIDVTQETLAEMIGTTRSRVNFFMNKFRKLGFIDYNGRLRVHDSLLSAVLKD